MGDVCKKGQFCLIGFLLGLFLCRLISKLSLLGPALTIEANPGECKQSDQRQICQHCPDCLVPRASDIDLKLFSVIAPDLITISASNHERVLSWRHVGKHRRSTGRYCNPSFIEPAQDVGIFTVSVAYEFQSGERDVEKILVMP